MNDRQFTIIGLMTYVAVTLGACIKTNKMLAKLCEKQPTERSK